jgi:hypothetical protein
VLSPELRKPSRIRSLAGPASPANAASWCHRRVVAARSAGVTGGRGTLANQTVPPPGSATWPKKARRPKIMCQTPGSADPALPGV